MTVSKESWKGWPNCYRIGNGIIDLIITSDVGPRILSAGFCNEQNHVHIFEEMAGRTGADKWMPYGGHRLWQAPEDHDRTYQPDNFSIPVKPLGDLALVASVEEPAVDIHKEIEIRLSPDSPCAALIHRVRNTGKTAQDLAPWSITMMAAGGTVVAPLPPRGSHVDNLLPTGLMAIWAYVDMSDPRWTWGHRHILLRQDPSATTLQKIGLRLPDGWAAYVRNNQMMVKFFDYVEGAQYPDLGCNFETFTNEFMLEVESLGPMVRLEPDATVEHVEHWVFAREVPTPRNEQDVEQVILPKVREGRNYKEKLAI